MAQADKQHRQGLGGPLVVAALILGVSVVAGALLIRSSLERGTAELAGVRTALAELPEAVKAGGAPAPARQAARPGRPDPNRRYTLKTEGAPAKGPQTAKIEIVEFSDFQ